jgi:hypothetical protein
MRRIFWRTNSHGHFPKETEAEHVQRGRGRGRGGRGRGRGGRGTRLLKVEI